jgi:RNA polymerase sigma-70 factor (ECF subfamily)
MMTDHPSVAGLRSVGEVRDLAGDPFSDLFDAHFPAVRAYARRRAPLEVADEVALATFEVAWRRRAELPVEPLPWLYGVARRTLANERRGNRRRSRLVERVSGAHGQGSFDAVSADPAAMAVESLAARSALGRLRPDDREVLMLVAWEGLDAEGAAAVLGITPSTFAVRLHRARRRLEALLPAAGSDSPNTEDRS